MAEGSFDFGYDDPDLDYDDDDETTPFLPGSASTPGPNGEEIPMKTMQKEKSGLPSYAETSFGGIKESALEKRLNAGVPI